MGQIPQVNAKCDVVMKLSVFGTRTDTHTRQNLYILATRAVIFGHRRHFLFRFFCELQKRPLHGFWYSR